MIDASFFQAVPYTATFPRARLAAGGKLAGVLGSLPLRTAVTASIFTSLAAALVLWLSLRTKENHS